MLLVQELVHDLNRHAQGNDVVLRLDMAKAYYLMSWSFIIQILRCFGLSERWVSLIRCVIYGLWLLVLVNGVSHGYFQSKRGFQ